MQKCLAFIGVLTALTAGAFAQDEETPATPKYRVAPPYPTACYPEAGAEIAPQTVTLMFDVDRDGRVENVRVRESSDPCFEDVATSTAHTWTYEPRRVNGSARAQEDLEVTVTFVMNQETATEDYDARPRVRVPPKYPERCMNVASRSESVTVRFDVTSQGDTENVQVIDTTQRCLNRAAMDAVKQWKYRPKVQSGAAVPRRGVETIIRFELSYGQGVPDEFRVRSRVKTQLMKAQRLAKDESTREEALAILEKLHDDYSADFSRMELSAFHHVRGIVRIQAGDYRGALDDLRLVHRLGMSGEGAAGVSETIEKLEEALGIAPDASVSAEPSERSGDAADEDQ